MGAFYLKSVGCPGLPSALSVRHRYIDVYQVIRTYFIQNKTPDFLPLNLVALLNTGESYPSR